MNTEMPEPEQLRDSATPGTPDDSPSIVSLARVTHIALITLPHDPDDNMRVGKRQEWAVLRVPEGHTAAQTLTADHPDLLVPLRSTDKPTAILLVPNDAVEEFDLPTYYRELAAEQIREAAAEVEKTERRQLRELMARYPDEAVTTK